MPSDPGPSTGGTSARPEWRTHAAFAIDHLESRPESVLTIASWVWRGWGFSSRRACAIDLLASDRHALPSRLVAVRDGDPVGVVNLIECNLPPRCDLRPWLAGLFVHPDHRREGIGAALVRACEAQARRLGFRRLFLYTERAEAFYERLGWSTIESSDWRGERIAVMTRAPG